ncbi:TIGR00270 family protein [Candidatus Woesearchaeota archaeon]|jgi:putative transcription factor|nr:TIGR00270 family protein [Candidatus Woesearchaeota archaeon]MBT4322060.1 TIGR00270 family protein [Candidatus Woesearchaeota archaeon]
MATCEMCGREGELIDAVVEGTMLKVCPVCSKHGKVVTLSKPSFVREIKTFEKREENVEVIVDDYSELIKTAREKKGLKQEELAKDVGERESIIHQIESGKMKPDFKLAKKLNFYLKIELMEKVSRIDVKKESKDIDFKDETITIGDLLKKK